MPDQAAVSSSTRTSSYPPEIGKWSDTLKTARVMYDEILSGIKEAKRKRGFAALQLADWDLYIATQEADPNHNDLSMRSKREQREKLLENVKSYDAMINTQTPPIFDTFKGLTSAQEGICHRRARAAHLVDAHFALTRRATNNTKLCFSDIRTEYRQRCTDAIMWNGLLSAPMTSDPDIYRERMNALSSIADMSFLDRYEIDVDLLDELQRLDVAVLRLERSVVQRG